MDEPETDRMVTAVGQFIIRLFLQISVEQIQALVKMVQTQSYIGPWILHTAERARSVDSYARSEIKKELPKWENDFLCTYSARININNMTSTDKELIHKALEAAYFIGTAVGEDEGGPKTFAIANNQRTIAARAARKRSEIQNIIELEAHIYWERKPEKSGKASDTARAIYRNVMARLDGLDKVPRAWRLRGAGDEKRITDLIRKIVSGLMAKGSSGLDN
jgi:hypothetical protein